MSPYLSQVSGAKPPPSPQPSNSTTWAKEYNIPYDYAAAYSVSQLSSGGYVVGALCTAAAVTTPNCNTLSEPTAMVMMVDSSGNIQSHTQYDYTRYPYYTALDRIRPTSYSSSKSMRQIRYCGSTSTPYEQTVPLRPWG